MLKRNGTSSNRTKVPKKSFICQKKNLNYWRLPSCRSPTQCTVEAGTFFSWRSKATAEEYKQVAEYCPASDDTTEMFW